MKAFLSSTLIISLATVLPSVLAATPVSGNQLFEANLVRRRTPLRPRASTQPHPPPPPPAHVALFLPEHKFIGCPDEGFQTQSEPRIFYDINGLVTLKCDVLAAGGGASECDYSGDTGLVIGSDRADGGKSCATPALKEPLADEQCATTCEGPNLAYAVVDAANGYTLCFYSTSDSNYTPGCFFDSTTGAPVDDLNSGTDCTGISVQQGTCAVTHAP